MRHSRDIESIHDQQRMCIFDLDHLHLAQGIYDEYHALDPLQLNPILNSHRYGHQQNMAHRQTALYHLECMQRALFANYELYTPSKSPIY